MEKISIKDELPITCKPVMLSGNPEVGKRFSYPLWRINRETLVFFSLLLIPSSIHTIYDTCVGKRVCVSVIHQYHETIPHTQPQKPSLLCEREWERKQREKNKRRIKIQNKNIFQKHTEKVFILECLDEFSFAVFAEWKFTFGSVFWWFSIQNNSRFVS